MENIQVALRVRPLNLKEALIQEKNYWQISDKSSNIYLMPKNVPDFNQYKRLNPKSCYSYTYDHCFSEETTNQIIYDQTIKNLVVSSLTGINGTIFMYGQTGAGKTYTMLGARPSETSISGESLIGKSNLYDDLKENSGVLLIALNDFFETMKEDSEKSYIIRCSYIEIYNENTYDLLSNDRNEILNIVEDVNQKEFIVKGVNEILVSSKQEIIEILKKGEINRHYAYTNLNHSSSRSHTIFSLKVKSISNNACLLTESQLNFVDLAGSEKLSNYQLTDEEPVERDYLSDNALSDNASSSNFAQRLKEGQSINKSLFFLTHVISLRSEGKMFTHIPYRNSPLTKILRSSLGGNSRTLIILCITPCLTQLEQTLSTMRFGVQAKKIENKIQANVITASNENETIKLLIEEYEKKLKDLEKERLDDKEKIKNLTNEMNKKIKLPKEIIKSEDLDIEFLDKIGLIFLTNESQKKQKAINDLLKNKLKANWQNLIFDSEGKIALEGYRKMKELQNFYLKNQKQYEVNFQDILKDFLELLEKYFNLEQKKFDYKSKAKSLFLKLSLSQKELNLVKARLNLFENFIGFNKLSLKEILSMEELFSKGMVHCQNERLNRITKKQPNSSYDEEESPRRNNRPQKLLEDIEFSEDEQIISSSDSFEELEKKIKTQEEVIKQKLKEEKARFKDLFTKKVDIISSKISIKYEDLRKFEQNYLDLLIKKTNEDRLNFISNELLISKNKENKEINKKLKLKVIKPAEKSSSSITEENFQEDKKPQTTLKPEPRKQRFRSLDEREFEELKIKNNKLLKVQEKPPKIKSRKDFVEINKKSLGFKPSLSKPLFETQKKDASIDSKTQKALERGNHFLGDKNLDPKYEVKSAQMPPRSPEFESTGKNTGDQENLSNDEDKKKLMNNPKNTLMALLSNLNNPATNAPKKAEPSKESSIFSKGNISESCAFKISNYKSILDKETMRVIEEKKKKLFLADNNNRFQQGSEPNESKIEKALETESFFSNCLNGFEYLLSPDFSDKITAKQIDDIAFENDSTVLKKPKSEQPSENKSKNSVFKKKKQEKGHNK